MLKECLEPFSVGPLVVGAIAFCLAPIQFWFFLRQHRRPWIGWGGVVCLGAALYNGTIFINYNAFTAPVLVLNERFQYTGVLIFTYAIIRMTYDFMGFKARRLGGALALAHLGWLVLLWGGDLLVSQQVTGRHLAWLSAPYLEPVLGPWGPAFLVYLVGTAGHPFLLAWLRRRQPPEGLGYMLAGFAFWGLLAIHDVRGALGHPTRLFVMEYGFLGFCFAIAGVTAQSYLRLTRELRQAQKLEALGMMAAGISHDFNNLLQIITASAEIMVMDPQRSPKDLTHLGHITRASAQGSKMVRNLLSLKRRLDLCPQPLDLNALVERAVQALRPSLPLSVTLKLHLAPSLPPALADADQLEQVVTNLMVNARDAMPSGGTLSLETSALEVGPRFPAAPGLAPGPYLRLVVSDTGMGMDETTQAHIFEPFFSTKPSGSGSGLGLAVAQRVLEALGGAIHCQSAPGRGASFRLYLPAAPEPAPPAPQPVPAATASLVAPKQAVLVVDDDPAVRQGLGEALRLAGYRVLLAPDCGQALTLLAGEEDGQVGAAIVDMHLPGLEGGPCLARLKALAPGIRTVLCSGDVRGPQAWAPALAQAQAEAFLPKPFTMRQILTLLEGLLPS